MVGAGVGGPMRRGMKRDWARRSGRRSLTPKRRLEMGRMSLRTQTIFGRAADLHRLRRSIEVRAGVGACILGADIA